MPDIKKIGQQSGALDQRVIFSRETLSNDGLGGREVSWKPFYACWAKVIPLSGRERDMASQTESPRNYRFYIRMNNESNQVMSKDRITWNGNVMNVRFIANAGQRHLYLEIDAEAGVAT